MAQSRFVSRLGFIVAYTAIGCALGWEASGAVVHAQAAAPTFKSGIDLVRVSAVVRDRKGRLVQNLSPADFEVMEGNTRRPILDFGRDMGGVSVALLFDVSGSMEALLARARDAAGQVLGWLEPGDDTAVFTFDTHLNEVAPFTAGLKRLPDSLATTIPFGATSLHDAIAATARRLGAREGRRRAVIVFTDGNDNASRMTPEEVSAVASSIDVPVYIFGVVLSIDNPESDDAAVTVDQSPFAGALASLAEWTGGRVLVASAPSQQNLAAKQIVEELRHQYLIAFESSGTPGWHPLAVQPRNKTFVVRARAAYNSAVDTRSDTGQSRPTASQEASHVP